MSSGSAAHVIDVATYNVHRCVGRDGREDAERIAAVVCELGATLVALFTCLLGLVIVAPVLGLATAVLYDNIARLKGPPYTEA